MVIMALAAKLTGYSRSILPTGWNYGGMKPLCIEPKDPEVLRTSLGAAYHEWPELKRYSGPNRKVTGGMAPAQGSVILRAPLPVSSGHLRCEVLRAPRLLHMPTPGRDTGAQSAC